MLRSAFLNSSHSWGMSSRAPTACSSFSAAEKISPGTDEVRDGRERLRRAWHEEIRRLANEGRCLQAEDETARAIKWFSDDPTLPDWNEEIRAERYLAFGREAERRGLYLQAVEHYRAALDSARDPAR